MWASVRRFNPNINMFWVWISLNDHSTWSVCKWTFKIITVMISLTIRGFQSDNYFPRGHQGDLKWNAVQFSTTPGQELDLGSFDENRKCREYSSVMSHGHSLMNFFWSLSISRTSNGSRSQPPIYRQCARPAPDKDLQPTRQIVDDHSATTPSSFNLNSIRETSALRCTISRWVTSISFGRFLKDCFDHYHII